ncbi:MAG: rRNA adenine N-6-methyltransferase family protein [Vicinamibacterales bacterium]
MERVLTLPPGAFRPVPKVSSAVVRLRFRPAAVDVGDPALFVRLVRAMFLRMLANALKPFADSPSTMARLSRAIVLPRSRRSFPVFRRSQLPGPASPTCPGGSDG